MSKEILPKRRVDSTESCAVGAEEKNYNSKEISILREQLREDEAVKEHWRLFGGHYHAKENPPADAEELFEAYLTTQAGLISKYDQSLEEFSTQMGSYEDFIEDVQEDVDNKSEHQHLLRFWYNYGDTKGGQKERLRIHIVSQEHKATIGILGPPHQSYSIYMPKEILEREPIEMLCFILDKYKKQQWWRY